MLKHTYQVLMAGAALTTGSFLALPGVASAATPRTFSQNQQLLEQQLSARVSQLGRLGTDVSSSKTLTAVHAALLSSRITTDTANMNALVLKVPNDTTNAELNADRASMIKDNRVFAVLTPQVFETISADAIAVQVTSFQGDEVALQSSVNSLVGQHGYKNAMNHYVAFVKQVNKANADSVNATTAVLAQTPADYPGDTHIFVRANVELRDAGVALAYASYDATVIGLASGGYTGA